MVYEPALQNYRKLGDTDVDRMAQVLVKPLEEEYHRREWSAGLMVPGPAAARALLANRSESLVVGNPEAGLVHHVAGGRARVPDDWQSGFLGLALRLAPADGGAGDATFLLSLSLVSDGDDHAAAATSSYSDGVTMPGVARQVVAYEATQYLAFTGAYSLVSWAVGRSSDSYAGAVHLLSVRVTFRPLEVQH